MSSLVFLGLREGRTSAGRWCPPVAIGKSAGSAIQAHQLEGTSETPNKQAGVPHPRPFSSAPPQTHPSQLRSKKTHPNHPTPKTLSSPQSPQLPCNSNKPNGRVPQNTLRSYPPHFSIMEVVRKTKRLRWPKAVAAFYSLLTTAANPLRQSILQTTAAE